MQPHILNIHRTGPNSACVRDLVTGHNLGQMEFQHAPGHDPKAAIIVRVRTWAGDVHAERIPAVGFMTRLSEIFERAEMAGAAA